MKDVNKNVEETLEVKTKQELTKSDYICGWALVAGLMTGSYFIGKKRAQYKIARGIDLMWAADPTLKDHMWGAFDKVSKTFKKK